MIGTQRLFVYGSLRRCSSHHHFMIKAHFLGDYVTPKHYTMYDLGAYPAVVSGGRHAVTGEVYQISRQTLRLLDRFEEYPQEYMRKIINTAFGPSWIYLWQQAQSHHPGQLRVVSSGDWCARPRS